MRYTIKCLFLLIATLVFSFQPHTLASGTQTAIFSMYCYWTGEATLGRLPGIISSQIGHLSGAGEIVSVNYDSDKVSFEELVRALKNQNSFYAYIARNKSEALQAKKILKNSEVKINKGEPHFIDSKHSLRTRYPELLRLDLTEEQAIKLNSWAYFGGKMPKVLTREQVAKLNQTR